MAARNLLKISAALFLALASLGGFAQTAPNEWTWLGGDSILPAGNTQYGIYGMLGTPAAGDFPGGRYGGSHWTDSSGNFWLFGGAGNDANTDGVSMNDLWKFDPMTSEWTWISGNSTGVFASPTYIDPAVYGTKGVFAAGNTPGGRLEASGWIDSSGHLWLFGGYGYDANNVGAYLNDLWEFDPSTNEWAWISGSSTAVGQQNGQIGVYGTQGTPASGNVPAARMDAASWIDNSGNLWLFGGFAQDDQGSVCDENSLNDFWEFSLTTKEWTWVGGSAPTGGCAFGPAPPAGVYGTLGTPAAGNIPAARSGATTWVDSKGHFWLFGGVVVEAEYTQGTLNDLWEFDPSTMLWTWVGGGQTVKQAGVYGTLGTPAAGNQPGSRTDAQGWTDGSGNLWLLGGGAVGFLDGEQIGIYNDFWMFNPSTNLWAWMGGSDTGTEAPGIYGTLGTPAPGNIPGARELAATWIDKSGHLWLFGGYGWDSVHQDGFLNDLWEYQPATGSSPVAVTPTVTVLPSPSSITTAQSDSVTVTVSGGGSNPTPTGSVTLSSGTYISAATTLVSGSAMITVPAGSLATGNDTLTATYSPDSTSSSTYNSATGTNSVTVTPAVTTVTPTVIVAPFPAAITTSDGLRVTVHVTVPSGGKTPTGSVTLSSGGYSSPATAVTGGVLLTVPAGSLAVGTDILTAEYTPDSNSASLYSSASGSAIETVTTGGPPPSITGEWVWRGGSSAVPMAGKGQPGVYGTLKTFAAGNIPGGRISPTTWTDKNGNFWLFGGQGTDANGNPGFLNDLWEFNPGTNQWAWMGGSNAVPAGSGSSAGQSGIYGSMGTPAAGNIPGGRSAGAGFTDSSGNLWLFGGYGYGTAGLFGGLSDVWEFSPSSGEWAWIAGSNGVNQTPASATTGTAAPGNTPGAHFGEIGWTDKNGNFWFFGGNTCLFGTCGYGSVPPDVSLDNSLWEFSPATKEWTFWTGGTYVTGYTTTVAPDYGILGTFSAQNYPGARTNGTGWTDSSGNLWMLGGWGFAGGEAGYLNDLWEFNPSLGEWAWVGGGTTTPAPTSGAAGAYGTLGSPSLGNNPGARMNATSWIDSNGNAWLFGGYGFDSTGAGGQLNDLWELNTASYEWTWVSGSSTIGTSGWPGIYGTLNVPAAGNTPGSRQQQAGWADGLGHIWMFGGNGLDKTSTAGLLNDVWEFEPGQAPLQTPTVTVMPNPASITTAQGDTVTVTVSGNPTPTGSVTLSSGTYISAAATLVSGSAMITVPAGSLATGSDTLAATYTPDSTSSSTYNSATGTNSVTVTAAALTSQTITVTTAAPASAADNSTFMVAATASSGLTVSIAGSGSCSGSGTGSATITMTAATGTCTVTYTQAGNSTYAAAPTVTSSTTATAAPLTSQTITVTTAAPASAADNSTFMVAATASSGLPVSITASGSCSGSGTGSATIAMTAATGTCTVTYNQAGNSTYAAAPTVTSMTSATAAALTGQTITVTTAAPASAADNSTFMVAATASSGLTVSIAGSGSCSGSGTGSATITMTAATGTCTVTYNQAGNSTYAAAPTVTSMTTATNAAPVPTFTLSSTPGAQTVQPGASAQYTIIATAQNGTFSGTVALSASGLPSGATAMFSPASVVPGSTSANSTLTIQTPAQARVEPARDPRWPLAVPALALVGFFFLPGKRRRRWISMAFLLIASLGVSTALTACGGGFGLVTAAPATNYNITVTGTSGSVVQTTTVQLTIE